MAAPRNVTVLRDEENGEAALEDDSPSAKKPKLERLPFNTWEFAAVVAVFFVFATGIFCIYLTMPATASAHLKLPRTLSDLRILKYPPFPFLGFPFSNHQNPFFQKKMIRVVNGG